MKKILLFGANGQLGSLIQEEARGSYAILSSILSIIEITRKECDFTKPLEISHCLNQHKPDFIINCAAYTAVDKAETQSKLAFAINKEALNPITEYLNQNSNTNKNTGLIHISTDYVFGEQKPIDKLKGFKTDEPCKPSGIYGQSKREGELLLSDKAPNQSMIIRTSWLYSEKFPSFFKTMVRLMQSRESLAVVDDQIGSPTYARTLAKAILGIIIDNKFKPGIFHYSNIKQCSWFDFAKAIHSHLEKNNPNLECKNLNPIPSAEYPTPAKRPEFSVLDNQSLIEHLGPDYFYDWQQGLELCMEEYKNL